MHVLIPAGGRGERLRPLTDQHPKPLLPLGDRPILSRIIGSIPAHVPVTVIVTHQLAPQFRAWREERHPEREITIHIEPTPSDGHAGGPVAALVDCVNALGLDEDVLVMMGDSVHPFHWDDFLGARKPGTMQIAAYRLPHDADATRFGVVEFSTAGWLSSFEEKPSEPRSRWIFTGCLYLPPRAIAMLSEVASGSLPQMGELVASYLSFGEAISVFPLSGEWHDIGTFDSYLKAHRAEMPGVEMERLRAQGNCLEGVVYVHPSARISGSSLRNCVVSGNSVIENAVLTDCVIRSNTVISNRVIHSKLVSSGGEQSVGLGALQ